MDFNPKNAYALFHYNLKRKSDSPVRKQLLILFIFRKATQEEEKGQTK